MNSQQLADCLLHHWQNLWPLPAAERIKRIDELRLDMTYQIQIEEVTREMARCDA